MPIEITQERRRPGTAARIMVVIALAGIAASKSRSLFADSPPVVKASASAEDTAIRPFRVHVPQQALTDLRRRIAATRWPDKETVADASQGVPLEKLQALVAYWGTGYDWRRAEA